MPIRRQHQRVAVGSAVRHADRSGNPRPVFDDDGLLPDSTELLRQDTGQDVGVAAGREWNDDFHRLVGIGRLRQRAGGRQKHCQQA